ncbi:MAG: hypothetical protein U1A78_33070 [Polyangia bacterium]
MPEPVEPELIPASQFSALVYCPRLFFLEHVEGEREDSAVKGAGTRLQDSVFQCDLSDREREQLITDLSPHIHGEEDPLLLIESIWLGPSEGRAARCARALGRLYKPPEQGPVIV